MWNTYFYHGKQYENFEAIFPNFKIPLNKQHNHMFSCSFAPVIWAIMKAVFVSRSFSLSWDVRNHEEKKNYLHCLSTEV